jgi:Flp pilus assembly pilin Flp
MKLFNSSKKKMLGQGMTEYIIIVALIAIAAIGVFSAFGTTVKSQVAAMAQELGGNSGSVATKAAGDSGKSAESKAAQNNKLNNFVDSNK